MSLARHKRLSALEDTLKAGYRAQWKTLLEGVLRWRRTERVRLKLHEIEHYLDSFDGLSCLDDWQGGEHPPEVREAALAWNAFEPGPRLERWVIEIADALTAYLEFNQLPEIPLPPLPSLEALEVRSASTRRTFSTIEQHLTLTLDPPRVMAWCRCFAYFTLEEEAMYRIHQSL